MTNVSIGRLNGKTNINYKCDDGNDGCAYSSSFELIDSKPIKGDTDTIIECLNSYLDKFKLTKKQLEVIAKAITKQRGKK